MGRKPKSWTVGRMRVTRFGSNLLFQTNWPQADFDKAQAELAAKYREEVATIDRLVDEIAVMVSGLPPAALMHRGWWEAARYQMKTGVESELEPETMLALRMIDYVQSVIASTLPQANAKTVLSEEDYRTLTNNVEELFFHFNHHYQVCATAKERAENTNYNHELEEFRFKAQVYWANIRGDRYQVHETIYLREMFLPYSEVLKELFGVSGEDFVHGLSQLVDHLAHGINDLIGEAVGFRDDVLAAMKKKIGEANRSAEEFEEIRALVIQENGWTARGKAARRNLISMDFFDVESRTSLPRALLDELAWGPGEEPDFFASGQFRGWPLRVWPVFRRPFLRLDNRIYCFDHYSLVDNIYRAIQRTVERLKPAYKQRWNEIQCQTTEDLPFAYLGRILSGATVIRPIYYPVNKGDGTKNWAEADGAVLYDDHMFVVEVKGGAFTQAPPSTDVSKYIRSLENLLLKPALQGKRFVEYLRSADSVPIYNKDHVQIRTLQHRDYRMITICPVTLDPLTELAAQMQHLRKIGLAITADSVWAISIDDLRVYADIFGSSLSFLHFVEQRVAAAQSDAIRLENELDHLGLYLKYNHYSAYINELQRESEAHMFFRGFHDDIDRFFAARMRDATAPCFLKQQAPPRFSEIIDVLSTSRGPGRARVASVLFDCDREWRSNLANWIEFELAQQPTRRRPTPIVIVDREAGAQIAFCWSPSVPRVGAVALDHAKSVLLLQGDDRGLLLELTYDLGSTLLAVHWTWLDASSISSQENKRLAEQVEHLRVARLGRATASSKLRRNDPCPCGSGKKHKRCCLER